MSYQSPYKEFIFEHASFNDETGVMTYQYSFDDSVRFTETVRFDAPSNYDRATFERAMFLGFVLAGVSYYKCYPTKQVRIRNGQLSAQQADFFSEVYRDGLSQFVYENGLSPDDIATFKPTSDVNAELNDYTGSGVVALQSGGKDSLLVAALLEEQGHAYTGWYLTQGHSYPRVLDGLKTTLRVPVRTIDLKSLRDQSEHGALNGHVPVTFINLSYAVVDAILHGESTVIAAIGQEGEEPHAYIGDYAIRHQWSKTWQAEQLFSRYVHTFVSPAIRVGSPLRSYSELKIAQLFAEYAWKRFGRTFSSCNVANYKQDHDNSDLKWCGDCPKCANSFLLFAPFVDSGELVRIFGSDLFNKHSLETTFKGLLGIEGIEKPFECVGEIDELRMAYQLARRNGYDGLPFDVPTSDFDIDHRADAQSWAVKMLQ